MVDSESVQFGFEAVASALSAGETGGEHHAVIGEGGVGDALLGNGFDELVDDGGAGDAVVCGD